MPGIIGIMPHPNDRLLDGMVDSIKHEKWYSVDRYADSFFGVARVHLGIFNPEPQPIFNDDRTLCIFMDGKIYGYGKEMDELKHKGYKFNVGNDPEFCLHLYEELGEDFILRLNGSFVIVIYDFKEKKLLIVNDRYGLMPHYYAINHGKLLFAPEVKAILQDNTFKKELNEEAVADFFAFGEILGDKTFFKGIEVLPPASIFIYKNNGKSSIKQYWNFNYKPDYNKSEDEFIDDVVKTFKEAVEIRMEDDYRYSVSLSGGLDSRSIVAAIEESARKNVLAFTFGPLDCDEVNIAKKVSSKAGTTHNVMEITPEMIIDNAEKEIFYSDGMDYIGVSYIPPIYKFIKEDNRDIVLDGLAFDLTLGGSYLTKRIINANKNELFKMLYHRQRHLFSEVEFDKLFVDSYYHQIKDIPLRSFKKQFNTVKESHPGNHCDHFTLRNHVRRWTVGGHILTRTCIENSVPTYDNAIMDVILKIPPELRLNHRIYRKFLKKLSSELAQIPYDHTMVSAAAPLMLWRIGSMYLRIKRKFKGIIWRVSKGKVIIHSKRSYVEFDEWLRTDENWKNYFRELLLSENTVSKKYLNQDFMSKLIQEHENGKQNNSMKILYLASFELFLRLFMSEIFENP